VFRGGWTVEAAETVCSGDGVDTLDVLDLLGRLVDKSLVLVVEGTDENRYRLLETVRQYGNGHLADADESTTTRTAHRDWCRSTVEAAAHVRGGEEQARWLERLESDHGSRPS
jgi:non-specific serine/threonine protein kinase